ncbi:sialate O-acetylesterase [Pedobacter alpinus]|uniref:Sialate O-acetylesterase n=1 Tax=Pedobacter alpinus TaxID=1590643 RepID=A0ABW5TQ41_9SPHI
MKKNLLLIFGFLILSFALRAEVKLPSLVGNGMVLQRDEQIKIWGWANAGEVVKVTFKNKTYTAKTDKDGKWLIKLDPQPAGGPFKIQINNKELSDILIGDVWLCAGQSNMEALLSRPNIKAKYTSEIATANYPMIRQFTVNRDMAFIPIADVASDKGWVSANPQTVLSFTAVGYFFAKDLYKKYKVPIGIINSSVGGTPAQSWVNSESLKEFPEYDKVWLQLKDTNEVARIINVHQLKTANWHKEITENDLGVNEKWFLETDHHDVNWEEVKDINQLGEKVNFPKYGSMWFKTEINIPANLVEKTAILSLGSMLTQDETYINGNQVGTMNSSYTDRFYTIAPGVLKAGNNKLVIRLISPTTGIGFNPKNNYQIKFGEDSIALNQPWKYKFGIELPQLPKGNGLSLHSPTAYYYAMIKPMANYNIKGIAWYQGESNVSKPEQHQHLLTSLIKTWRNDWQKPDLPFLFVQLANYLATGTEPEISNWALLREAQMKTLKTPHTAMVVIHDVGEKNDIHPANKQDVGKRLALAAQKMAYHEDIVYSGPIYKSIKISGNQVYVSFNHVGSGLKMVGKQLEQFSISADGKNFVKADAKIVGNQVVVWAKDITKPIAVRYAWADAPEGANLYNKEGLPASSFKSN